MTALELSALFFLQLCVIVCTCRMLGRVLSALGQPQVVSEMIAGVLLGPSLLGWVAPETSALLFPAESRPILFAVAQLGLVLYMFLVGCEFDIDELRSKARSAVSISVAGMVAPFALGAVIAWFWVSDTRLFPAGTEAVHAMLFLGAAMSITAFPMLARMIYEQGLSKTSIGTLALAAGASDDAAAWCILAVVLAGIQGDPAIAALAIGGGLGFALLVLLGVRPWLAPVGRRVETQGQLDDLTLALTLAGVMLAAWWTDTIQIYAVFGAFLMGLAIPRGAYARALQDQLRPLTVTILLPVFFVYSGLHTKISLVNTWELVGLTLAVLLAASLGKGGACYAAARWSGRPHHEAVGIGALMNARGLMELIILNIGLQKGLIEPTLFTIMVLMAVATTLMTNPIFKSLRIKERMGWQTPT